VKEVKEVKEVKVKEEMEDGEEDITTISTTTATVATLAGTQLLALESAQDALASVPTAQEEEGPVGLSGQTGLGAKTQAEMDMEPGNEPENGNQNTITSSLIIAAQTETQIPPLLTNDHSSPAIATSSTPPPTTVHETATATATTTEEIMKTPRAETPQKALESAQRRNVRILESVQASAQNLVDILTMQEGLTPTTLGPSPGSKTAPKSMSSPILNPKPGAGVRKNKAPSRTPTPSQTPSPKIKKESPQVEEEKEENQNQTQNTTAVTTTKHRRGKTPGKVPQVPQRRSMRIKESTEKKAQAKPLPTIIKPESPILKPKDGAGVSKRGGRGRGGSRGGRGRGAARGVRGG